MGGSVLTSDEGTLALGGHGVFLGSAVKGFVGIVRVRRDSRFSSLRPRLCAYTERSSFSSGSCELQRIRIADDC